MQTAFKMTINKQIETNPILPFMGNKELNLLFTWSRWNVSTMQILKI